VATSADRQPKSGRSGTDSAIVLNTWTTAILCILTGVGLELGIHALSGRREAWDSEEFWTLGLPVAFLVSVIIGLLSRRRDWLWALAVAPSQVATMMIRSGEIGGLWPLTIVFSSILSAPFVVAAFAGSRLRRAGPASAN
jgi:hypothetical protein